VLHNAVNYYIVIAMEYRSTTTAPRRTGRPLSFDRETALQSAMHVFWQHGFEGASIAELTRAMHITAPSLYTAFGDKQKLFSECVDVYLGGTGSVPRQIANASTAREAAQDLLVAAAIGDTGEHTPPGCLVASSIVTCSHSSAGVREELADIRRMIAGALQARIERDIQKGLLPPDSDAEALAGHIFAVVQGMSTLAKDGADRGKLMKIVVAAMAGWPKI
jgi:AcrR family transcriptional regulator